MNGLLRCGLFVIGALALSGQAGAASSGVTLAEALAQAERNNPDLAAAGWSIAIAQGERTQAGLLPNPELSWEVEDTRSDTRTSTLQITQPIELGGKRGARIAVAERGSDAAAVELERARNQLRAEVIQAFHGVLQAQMRAELAEQSLALAERGVTIAEGRVRAGKVSPIEQTRARVQLSEVRLELRRARSALVAGQSRLQVVLGSDPSARLRALGEATALPAMPGPERLRGALADSADLRLARLVVDRQEASFELEKTQRIPDLNVTLGSQYSSEDKERVNVVGLSMPIPLFNRNQGNILAAARRADQARDQRNAAQLRLQGLVEDAVAQWDAASVEIDVLGGSVLPAAQNAVDSTARGFEMGKFAFLDVLDAQRTLIQARLQLIQALAAATDSWVRLERIYGDLSVFAHAPQ
ncbi:TolC family protein [Pseudomonas sp. LRF_L74]|uniref:TolC family protein n=1 Tax=Pseudomonas sp. LRF_L74 TaxID=3369422 RepID=UPI003F5DAED3